MYMYNCTLRSAYFPFFHLLLVQKIVYFYAICCLVLTFDFYMKKEILFNFAHNKLCVNAKYHYFRLIRAATAVCSRSVCYNQ